MSGRPVPRPPRRQQPQAKPTGDRRDYDLARWADNGKLGAKHFVRKATEVSTGRQGIIKHLSDPPRPGEKYNKKQRELRQRFYNEALFMRQVNGTPGILPIWDIDDAHGGTPHWYAMPRALPLASAYGDTSTVVDVVTHVAALSQTLAALAEQDTFHRDIKPDNLLFYDGTPVLADFGIAAFAQPAGLTLQGDKVGPANFIAPEMRSTSVTDRGRKADVYSLAKTLFVLAHKSRGPYPPDGTHRVDAEEFSLASLGNNLNATMALGHVLEAATEFDVGNRLTMAEFHEELRAWLDRHATDRFTSFGSRSFWSGWGPDLSDRHRRDVEATRTMMRQCIHRIAKALIGDADAWSEGIDHDHGDATLGDYEWVPNSEDGFEPDGGSLWMATHVHDGRRVVLEAVFDYDVCFLAECQLGGPPWTLQQQWGHTSWRRPRMPRTGRQLQELTDEVVAWLSQPVPDTPATASPGQEPTTAESSWRRSR
ncbi:protein kinase [Streptomyces sp. NPDC004232]|uniref:protein kinase domain-containing protein n=1 Tax=Streptomyces sp. NPDC004232 TaxID=3154454 RepID=UPI0033A4D27F